jgi:hypothetical protein
MDEKEKVEEVAPAGVNKEEVKTESKEETKPTGVPAAGGISGVNGPMPAELHGWNWGAFCLSWLWGITNGTYISLLSLIPAANVIMMFVLGAKGNEWAWQNRKFESVAQFKAVQKAWTIWGLVILGLGILMTILTWGAIFALIATGTIDADTVDNTIIY